MYTKLEGAAADHVTTAEVVAPAQPSLFFFTTPISADCRQADRGTSRRQKAAAHPAKETPLHA